MESRGIKVEDAGNIELMTFKEIDTESRKYSISNEETDEDRPQAQKKTDCRCFPAKTIIWKTFKSIVFFICLIFVVIQSVEFYNIYSEYPTNMVQKSIFMKEVKLPAVTVCFKQTISTMKFCYYNPNHCERPNNLTEFCEKHPIHCQGDTSNLTIPKTNEPWILPRVMKQYLFIDSIYDPLLWDINRLHFETRTFVENKENVYKCYSKNLHLYQSGSKLDTAEIKFNGVAPYVSMLLELYKIEFFDLLNEPQVFLGIHSPFIPMNPVLDGLAIRLGYDYEIEVRLEREENLMPPPYQTNCRDNGPSNDTKNFTNPNSYEMCLEMCESEIRRSYYKCDGRLTMISSPKDLCQRGIQVNMSSEHERELEERRVSCVQNCRSGCLKLHYKIKIKERKLVERTGRVYIQIDVRNKKVISERHVPLYGSGELFSHIGGLIGYWLGISVLNFLDIIYDFYGKAIILWTRFRKFKVQKTPTYENLV